MPFFDRLEYYKQEKDYKTTQLHNTYNFYKQPQDFVNNSSQDMENQENIPFHPRTGRSPEYRNVNNMPVGMYLYEKAFIKQRRNEILADQLDEEIRLRRQVKTTNNMSEKIVETIKYKRLEEIFELLDSDNDGIISNSKIDISNLPTSI